MAGIAPKAVNDDQTPRDWWLTKQLTGFFSGRRPLRDTGSPAFEKFVMPQYRINFVDPAGYISSPSQIMICLDDEDAKQKARQLINGLDIELWQGARLVELFGHK
jgi:hypothetical protein